MVTNWNLENHHGQENETSRGSQNYPTEQIGTSMTELHLEIDNFQSLIHS